MIPSYLMFKDDLKKLADGIVELKSKLKALEDRVAGLEKSMAKS